MRFLSKRILLYLNLFFSFLFLLSLLASKLNPESWWIFSLVALSFPFLIIIQILFFIIWVIFIKRYFILSLLTLIIGYKSILATFSISIHNNSTPEFTVFTHNLKAFHLNGPKFQMESGNKIFQFYKNHKADIYCFQEFLNCDRRNYSPIDSVRKYTRTISEHIEYKVHFRMNHFGLATISKYPIVGKGIIDIPASGTNMCIYTDLLINTDTVRVFNMHLASVHLRQANYEFIRNLDNPEYSRNIEETWSILDLLKKAFIKRGRQAKSIQNAIQNSPFPVIVCGDFNDTPTSYAYNHILGNLSDSFLQKGNFIGNTFNGFLPWFRIDYILSSKKWETTSYKIFKEDLTDHFPILAGFKKAEINE